MKMSVAGLSDCRSRSRIDVSRLSVIVSACLMQPITGSVLACDKM